MRWVSRWSRGKARPARVNWQSIPTRAFNCFFFATWLVERGTLGPRRNLDRALCEAKFLIEWMSVWRRWMSEWVVSHLHAKHWFRSRGFVGCQATDVDILRKSENSPIEWQDRLALVSCHPLSDDCSTRKNDSSALPIQVFCYMAVTDKKKPSQSKNKTSRSVCNRSQKRNDFDYVEKYREYIQPHRAAIISSMLWTVRCLEWLCKCYYSLASYRNRKERVSESDKTATDWWANSNKLRKKY